MLTLPRPRGYRPRQMREPLRDRLAGYTSETVEPQKIFAAQPVYPTSPPLAPPVTQAANGRWAYSPNTPLAQPAAVRPAVPPVVRTPLRPPTTPRPVPATDDGGVIFLDSDAVATPVRPAANDSDIMFIQ